MWKEISTTPFGKSPPAPWPPTSLQSPAGRSVSPRWPEVARPSDLDNIEPTLKCKVKTKKEATIALHDLTGFEGRCGAIPFCKDTDFKLIDDDAALTKFRSKPLNLPDKPDEGGSYDVVVLGGGLASTCNALSAARQGLSVALVQGRPVLGGSGSSEVCVWPEGQTHQEPCFHVVDIVGEILPQHEKTDNMTNNHKARRA